MVAKSQRSVDAEQRFCKQLADINAVPDYREWLGCLKNHDVICSCGRKWTVRPDVINRGIRGCRECYLDKKVQLACGKFDDDLALKGLTRKEEYAGNDKLHAVTCKMGHSLFVSPAGVVKAKNPCLQCNALIDYERLGNIIISKGGLLIESEWLGYFSPHRAICIYGHECYPIPASMYKGRNVCSICSRCSFTEAGNWFKKWLTKNNIRLIESDYLGARKLHRIICKNGHLTAVRPNWIQQGGGPCRFCSGMIWDVFYVVADNDYNIVKFGITSGNARPRLLRHHRNGFSKRIRLLDNLPGTVAPDLERLCLSTLRDAGWTPVRGREYFDIAALPTVLDIVDNYPITKT